MAVVAPTRYTPSPGTTIGERLPNDTTLIVWGPLANSDTGGPLALGEYADACVQFDGTFGAGGTIILQGSNDGASWFTLTDIQTSAISKTSAGLEQVAEMPLYVRPNVTGGDGTTALYCRVYGRRGR